MRARAWSWVRATGGGLAMIAVLGTAVVPATADSSTVTPTAALDCRDPIGAHAPSSDVRVFDQQVALMTSRTSHRAMQAVEFRDPVTPGYRYFAKTPIMLRTGEGSAEIVVPRSERGRVALSWGNTDHDGIADRVFRVGPCTGAATWIVFPGGYSLTEPHCVHLVVRVDDHEQRFRVGVGAACPGQRPPAEG